MYLATGTLRYYSPDRRDFASTSDRDGLVIEPRIGRRSLVVEQVEPVTKDLRQISRGGGKILDCGIGCQSPIACLVETHGN